MISFLNDEFNQLNDLIKKIHPTKLFILVDENTHEHCLPLLLSNLQTEIPFEIIEIEAGEEMKSVETANQLWEILTDFEADRKSLLINLGGGVITDLGGFTASTYKRGIPFIHIPTTLLAMCDASIGGKTGVDLRFMKNMVGTFALPEQIFVYPEFLKTLPFEEVRSGFAEMLKHGLIANKNHWNDLKNIDDLTVENLAPHIQKSMEIKQYFVEQDFKEQNIRKALNFGHTFGHALESLYLKAENPIRHGEAVAMGMVMESYLSLQNEELLQSDFEEIQDAIFSFFPYLDITKFKETDLFELLLNDKKNNSELINFTLLSSIGQYKINCYKDLDDINQAVKFYKTKQMF